MRFNVGNCGFIKLLGAVCLAANLISCTGLKGAKVTDVISSNSDSNLPSDQPNPTPTPQPTPTPTPPKTDGPIGTGQPGSQVILFADVDAGPVTGGPDNLGTPIAIFGKGFGAARGTSKVTIGGVEVANYRVWGQNNANNTTLDMIVVQPGPNVKSGDIVVNVGGKTSNVNHKFTVRAGNILYISLQGNNSNACTEAAPCATVQDIVGGKMKAGDILLLRGGNYTENEIWLRTEYSGAAGQSKVIKNYPGETVTFTVGSRPFIVDASFITVSGFHFKDGKPLGLGNEQSQGNRAYNCTFAGAIAWDAIGMHGNDHIMAGNVCEVDSSSVGTQGHCYYISHGSNLKILYNVGSNAPGYGLHIFDQRRQANDIKRIISNVLVEGNILKNSPQRAGMIISMEDEDKIGNYISGIIVRNNIFVGNNFMGLVISGGAKIENIEISNNTFYENGKQGITVGGGTNITGISIKNNLVYQADNTVCKTYCTWYTTQHIEVGANSGVTVSNNSYHPASPLLKGTTDAQAVTGTVTFANPATFDFRTLAGSANIDKGLVLSSVPGDFNGTARPQGSAPDTGAFEFGM